MLGFDDALSTLHDTIIKYSYNVVNINLLWQLISKAPF
jgi:hypothetical protein